MLVVRDLRNKFHNYEKKESGYLIIKEITMRRYISIFFE